MYSRLRRSGPAVAALLLVVLLEAAALRLDVLGQVVLGVVAGLALITFVARANLIRIGTGAAVLAAFTISWNGWYVGPVRPGDVLAPIALLCFVVGRPNDATRTPPWWIKQLVFAILLVTTLTVLLPIDPAYLTHRLVLDAGGMRIDEHGSPLVGNLGVAAKFVVAVVVPPMAFVAAALADRRAVHWLAIAFVSGTSLSGFAAAADHFLHTSLGEIVTGLPNVIDRQAGFTTQPNYLAASVVLALPLACWLIAGGSRRLPVLGWASLVCCVLGAFASGSRGGAVTVVFAAVVAFLLLPRTRGAVPAIVLAGLAGAGVVATAVPSLGEAILRVTRLSGNPTTTGSDIVRGLVGAQGVRDWFHSPLYGIGLHVSTEASQVYLQELASGGLLLFVAVNVYMLAGLRVSLRLIAVDDLAAALGASVIATLALNLFEADLTDRFYYIPQALIVALAVVHGRRVVARDEPDETVDEAPTLLPALEPVA